MNDLDMLKTAGLSTTGLAILLLAYRVLKTLNGKKLTSRCCDRKMEVGFQVGDMSNTPKVETTENPMNKPVIVVQP